MFEFSKTEHAQKTLIRITNEGQCMGAVRISTAFHKTIQTLSLQISLYPVKNMYSAMQIHPQISFHQIQKSNILHKNRFYQSNIYFIQNNELRKMI